MSELAGQGFGGQIWYLLSVVSRGIERSGSEHPTDHWVAAGSSNTQCSLQPAAAASSCRHLLSLQGYKRRIPEPRTQFRQPSSIVWYSKICLKTRSDQQGASHRHLPSAMAKLALLLLAIALLAAPAFAQGPQSRKLLDAVANADASAYSSGGALPNTQLRASGRSGVARPTSPLPGSPQALRRPTPVPAPAALEAVATPGQRGRAAAPPARAPPLTRRAHRARRATPGATPTARPLPWRPPWPRATGESER